MAYLKLSRRALLDIEEIEKISIEKWGQKVADAYLNSIEEALLRLIQKPNLLRSKPQVSKYFHFYQIRKHFLVCTLVKNNIYVLAVKHGAMDLPLRIAELEPQLLGEAEILHKAFLKK